MGLADTGAVREREDRRRAEEGRGGAPRSRGRSVRRRCRRRRRVRRRSRPAHRALAGRRTAPVRQRARQAPPDREAAGAVPRVADGGPGTSRRPTRDAGGGQPRQASGGCSRSAGQGGLQVHRRSLRHGGPEGRPVVRRTSRPAPGRAGPGRPRPAPRRRAGGRPARVPRGDRGCARPRSEGGPRDPRGRLQHGGRRAFQPQRRGAGQDPRRVRSTPRASSSVPRSTPCGRKRSGRSTARSGALRSSPARGRGSWSRRSPRVRDAGQRCGLGRRPCGTPGPTSSARLGPSPSGTSPRRP